MYKAIPISLVGDHNYYSPLPNGAWVITDPSQTTLSFRLDIDDSLGQRPYVASAGSLISVIFQRAANITLSQVTASSFSAQQTESQTVTKNATANSSNPSIWSISLTSQDVEAILSGTVKFSLTESSIAKTWLQNWAVEKKLTSKGF